LDTETSEATTPGPNIEVAAEVLRRAGLVAFPTETVYGLGADAANPKALQRLYTVKQRPLGHPVIVHVGRDADLAEYARDLPDVASALARAFWPGPLTLVAWKRSGRIADAATGGRESVGLRVPDHPVALALLDAFGGGIAAPSANRFGRVSPTTAAHVRADLGDDVDLVLDGGSARVGVESTIVDVTGGEPVILRVGGVGAEDLERVCGAVPTRRDTGEIPAPGTLAAHYAPDARVEVVGRDDVITCATAYSDAGTRVGILAIDPPAGLPAGVHVLGPPSDTAEYARVLYARLREADSMRLDVVLAVPPPETGVGLAVMDRLRRASANSPAPRR
jgi:L-threonylcarbamoyladenylate synthase